MPQFKESGRMTKPCLICGKPTYIRSLDDKPLCSRICRSKYMQTVKYYGTRSESVNRPKVTPHERGYSETIK